MPRQVLLSLIVEAALVLLTVLLLSQPRFMVNSESERAKRAATLGGMVFLCITFCWSFIFGCILTLNEMVLRI